MFFNTAREDTKEGAKPYDGKKTWSLTRIPIPSRVYLIDTGNEGHARDSRTP